MLGTSSPARNIQRSGPGDVGLLRAEDSLHRSLEVVSVPTGTEEPVGTDSKCSRRHLWGSWEKGVREGPEGLSPRLPSAVSPPGESCSS